MILEFLGALSRTIVGGTLVASSLTKAGGLEAFAAVLRSFPITRWIAKGQRVPRVIAAAIIAGEGISGLAFFLGLRLPWSGFAVVALLGAFSIGVALVLLRGESVSCGCFGSSSAKVSLATLARNLLLIAVATIGTANATISLDSVRAGSASTDDYLAAMMGTISIAVLLAVSVSFSQVRRSPHYMKPPGGFSSEPSIGAVWDGPALDQGGIGPEERS
jgi:hypothetical protein